MHKESPRTKNSFLEDLDKLEVNGSEKKILSSFMACVKLGGRKSVCLLLVFMEV